MHVIEILLPRRFNDQKPIPSHFFEEVQVKLTDKFGGVTAFLRNPAQGLWKEHSGKIKPDEIIVLEVMASEIDLEWWHSYKKSLLEVFRQKELVIRSSKVDLL